MSIMFGDVIIIVKCCGVFVVSMCVDFVKNNY